MSEPAAEFAVLGPVQVLVAGRAVEIRSVRQRTLLAALILRAGRAASREHLLDILWGDAQPADPRGALQSQVMRLRRALGRAGTLVRTDGEGYRLDVDPMHCDVHRFRALTRSAASAERPADVLREALENWRGEPLTGVDSEALAPSAAALAEERLEALERRISFDLDGGLHPILVAELSELTGQWPLREQLWTQLMTALYRSGRQADALTAYQSVRVTLRDELGVEPGPDLQRVHAAVLAGTLDPPASTRSDRTAPGAAPAWSAQRQLPLDVTDFVGREDVAAAIAESLIVPGGMPLVVVSGLAGVGKSALATRVAHRLGEAFPDGQWHLRLGGGGDAPRAPEHLLDTLLRLVGVDPAAIPSDVDVQSALLRSRLAGRRVLLVLDDAAGVEQIEPLLPGTPGCAVLVTSRNQLVGLTALHGARPFPLDVLPADGSLDLLASVLGGRRIGAEPAAARDIAGLCGHLPLALRIAGANLAHHPEVTLEHYARRLRGNRLGELSVDGSVHAVRDAFDVSVDSLSPDAQQAFVQLGSAPGADVSAEAAAALQGVPLAESEQTLRRLCAANLLVRTASDRYGMHDLVREYAATRRDLHDADEAFAGRGRLLAWYLRTADAASARVGFVSAARLSRPAPAPERFSDAAQARAWLDAELPNLVAVVEYAAADGPAHYAWEIADALRVYLHQQRHIAAFRPIAACGLAAAEATDDPLALGAMQHSYGQLQVTLGDQLAARAWYERAIEGYRRGGFALGEGILLNNIGVVRANAGDLPGALEYNDQAIAVFAAADRPDLAALSRANRTSTLKTLGRLDEAIDSATAALGQSHRRAQLVALINRAGAYGALGRYEDGYADATVAMELVSQWADIEGGVSARVELARRCLDVGQTGRAVELTEEALAMARNTADSVHEVEALAALGVARRVAGRADLAVPACRDAIARIESEFDEFLPGALIALASALHETGDPEQAWLEADRAARLAVDYSQRLNEGRALGVLAVVSGRLGRGDESAEFARRAQAIAADTGYVPARHELWPGAAASTTAGESHLTADWQRHAPT